MDIQALLKAWPVYLMAMGAAAAGGGGVEFFTPDQIEIATQLENRLATIENELKGLNKQVDWLVDRYLTQRGL